MSPKRWTILALILPIILSLSLTSCDNSEPIATDANLKVRFTFSPTQERLDNLGQTATLPSGHAGLNPVFRKMSAHFIELVPSQIVPYKAGAELFQGAEVAANNPNPYGFTTAIDFDEAVQIGDQEVFTEIPIADLAPGTYEHVRISVSYQLYDVLFNLNNIPNVGDLKNQTGTIASFVGFNTKINELEVNANTLQVNEPKLQGFWAFEPQFSAPLTAFNEISSGQAPQNATTVVNPFPNFPIPQGSCVVVGSLDRPITITGTEEQDIELLFSFSINQSFEWIDLNGNGEWDLDTQDPSKSEKIVDMGLRGIKVFVQ